MFISDNPIWHKEIRNNKIHINLENFILEIQLAMEEYFSELDGQDSIRQLALQRYDSLSIIVKMNVDDDNILRLDNELYTTKTLE